MQIYIYAEADNLEEIAAPLADKLSHWVKKSKLSVEYINHQSDFGSDNNREAFWNLGIHISAKRRSDLRKTLEFLYKLSKEQHCEFVVGLASSETSPATDICYFGYEEGRPDTHEIAHGF